MAKDITFYFKQTKSKIDLPSSSHDFYEENLSRASEECKSIDEKNYTVIESESESEKRKIEYIAQLEKKYCG